MSRITSRDVRSLMPWQRAGHLNDPPVWFRTLADQMDADNLRLTALEQERDRLRDIILWALGERGEFLLPPERVRGKPYPHYWWRTEMRRRLDAALAGTAQEPASGREGE